MHFFYSFPDMKLRFGRNKTTKLVAETVREGTAQFLSGDMSVLGDGKPRWEKCRLSLVRASGGHILEFFAPPKVRQVNLFVPLPILLYVGHDEGTG